VDQKGAKRKVVMIHRTVLGSLERFMGCLVEHYGGAFPVWLSPTQCIVLNIGKAQRQYAQRVFDKLQEKGLRAAKDFENKTMAKKIRDAQSQKIPYMLVVGDKEVKKKTINVRNRAGKMTEMKLEDFLKILKEEIIKKK
jgi:threonyl-tRNA synthetase